MSKIFISAIFMRFGVRTLLCGVIMQDAMPPKARKGPDAHASQTPVGTKMKGNDGDMWVVATAANGVKRWVTLKSAKVAATAAKGAVPTSARNAYLVHDNGGRPFLVVYDAKRFSIYQENKKCVEAVYEEQEKPGFFESVLLRSKPRRERELAMFRSCYTKHVFTSPYVRVLVGKDQDADGSSGDAYFDGNSMLFEIPGGVYVCVGEKVISFKPREKIVKYLSPVGNSDVPYPYAIGEKNELYLTLEPVVLFKADVAPGRDPYSVAWFSDVKHLPTANKKAREYAAKHKLPGLKVIQKRLY